MPKTSSSDVTPEQAGRHRSRVRGTVAAALATVATVSFLSANPVDAHAQPACAMRMVIRTGADDLRAGSDFWVALNVRGTDPRFPTQPDGNHRVFLHSNNNLSFGSDGLKSWSERTFWVAPSFGTPDGSGCPRSENILGVGIQFNADLDGWGSDQWDNAGLTLTDSVNGRTYWRSTSNTRFKSEARDWKTTNPNPSAAWVRGF